MSVPHLRFPEFDTDWGPVTIGSMIERVSQSIDVDPTAEYREIGVRSHGKGIFHKDTVTGESLGNKRVFKVVQNALVLNIVFAWERAVALTSVAEIDFIASHRFPMFIEIEGKSHLAFLRHFFLTKRGKLLLELASPGGAGRNKTLGQSGFLKLKPVVPERKEQKKISNAIDAVDATISALQSKQEALNRFKTGLMQQIFTQRLRFTRDDGTSFPDWKEMQFGDMVDWHRNNNLSRINLTNKVGPVQNIHYGDVHGKFRPQFWQSRASAPFIEDLDAVQKINGDDFCQIGDLIFADASEDHADIGKVIEVLEVTPKSLVAGLHTHLARPRNDCLAVGFSGYLLRTQDARRQIMRFSQGISVLGISKRNLSNVAVLRPHIDEQKKIATSLMSLETKIEALSDQIVQIEQFKKGLLQQLFV